MSTPGEIVELTIEKAAAGGRMLARLDGQVTLAQLLGVATQRAVRMRARGCESHPCAVVLDGLLPVTSTTRSG